MHRFHYAGMLRGIIVVQKSIGLFLNNRWAYSAAAAAAAARAVWAYDETRTIYARMRFVYWNYIWA